jgi:hypothetical protein
MLSDQVVNLEFRNVEDQLIACVHVHYKGMHYCVQGHWLCLLLLPPPSIQFTQSLVEMQLLGWMHSCPDSACVLEVQ